MTLDQRQHSPLTPPGRDVRNFMDCWSSGGRGCSGSQHQHQHHGRCKSSKDSRILRGAEILRKQLEEQFYHAEEHHQEGAVAISDEDTGAIERDLLLGTANATTTTTTTNSVSFNSDNESEFSDPWTSQTTRRVEKTPLALQQRQLSVAFEEATEEIADAGDDPDESTVSYGTWNHGADCSIATFPSLGDAAAWAQRATAEMPYDGVDEADALQREMQHLHLHHGTSAGTTERPSTDVAVVSPDGRGEEVGIPEESVSASDLALVPHPSPKYHPDDSDDTPDTPVMYMGRDGCIQTKVHTYLVKSLDDSLDVSSTSYEDEEEEQEVPAAEYGGDLLLSHSHCGGGGDRGEISADYAYYAEQEFDLLHEDPRVYAAENAVPSPAFLPKKEGTVATAAASDRFRREPLRQRQEQEERAGPPAAPRRLLDDAASGAPVIAGSPMMISPQAHQSPYDQDHEQGNGGRPVPLAAPGTPPPVSTQHYNRCNPSSEGSDELVVPDVPSPLTIAYEILLEDPAWQHAQNAGYLWQSLVGQHVRFPSHWWNGARSPPMGLTNTFGGPMSDRKQWEYWGPMRHTAEGHTLLNHLVRDRSSPGRLLLHVVVQDLLSWIPVLDVCIGCYHPQARGIRQTVSADPLQRDRRQLWMSVRRHNADMPSVVDPLLQQLQQQQHLRGDGNVQVTHNPLGACGRRIDNTNVRAVFGELPPLETVFVTESELFERMADLHQRSEPIVMGLLKRYAFS